jgi:hypothetical protein
MAERILMNEYKALAKEDWVNIEVRPLYYMDMFRLWGQGFGDHGPWGILDLLPPVSLQIMTSSLT